MTEQTKPRMIFDVDARAAWGAAFAAQRINGRYIKQGEWAVNADGKEIPCNKELMIALLQETSLIEQEDFSNGEKAREWFQGQLFALLGDQLNDFMKKAAEVSVKDMISLRVDSGMVACLPATWLRASNKERVADVIAESDSKHVGSVTEKIVRMVEVLDVMPGKTFTGWLVTVTDGNNLFRFCSSFEFKTGEAVRIQGKVKRHDSDRETGKPVTWLNYVKKLIQ